VAAAKAQAQGGDKQLDAAVGPVLEQIPEVWATHVTPLDRQDRRHHLFEEPLSACKIDDAAIVGVDQCEIPQLGPLIEVGNAWRRELQDELGE